MKKFRILSVLLTVIAFASCEKEPKVYDLKVGENSFSIPRSGAETRAFVNVSSNASWIAESDSPWLSVMPKSGEAGKVYSVQISASENDVPSVRTGIITVTSGTVSKTITVTQAQGARTMKPSDVPDYEKIYIPKEFKSDGFLRSDGHWFFGRSAQSEHFIVFWEAGYGEDGGVTPSQCSNPKYKVNIDDLLKWAEKCYDTYINVLGFTEKGNSLLDKYKFEIFLHYQDEWAAYGFGQDNVVGCLWLNPEAARYNSTVAHEIGHSFQYQTYCDRVFNSLAPDNLSTSFRYTRSENGTGFWEQTSQWQSMVMCPDEIFTNWYFDCYGYPSETESAKDLGCFVRNTRGHVLHEITRYSNYFIHFYWVDKYGIDFISKIWKSSVTPQDALETYMAVMDLSVDELNQDLYSYAARCATWDYSICAEAGLKHLDEFAWNGTEGDDGYVKVGVNRAPEATGFNVITLKGFKAGESVTMDFVGLPSEPGYGKIGDPAIGAWTVGFVGLSADGTRFYSPSAIAQPSNDDTVSVSWTIPAGITKLWAIVSATPVKYMTHYWDENGSNDVYWPYKVKFDGASISR